MSFPFPSRVVFVGAGGIGSNLLPYAIKFMAYDEKLVKLPVLIIDGDCYTKANLSRQDIPFDEGEESLGNKAYMQWKHFKKLYPQMTFDYSGQYLVGKPESNLPDLIKEGDLILSGVDNHATRLLISQYAQKLKNVTVISGGNDLVTGTVYVYIRQKRKNITDPVEKNHEEIAHPADKNPGEDNDCLNEAVSKPQLVITNLAVASAMLNAFYTICSGHNIDYSIVYFDIIQNKIVSRL